jgi:hypothetical protein
MLSKNQKAYTVKMLKQMSANELKAVALELVDDIQLSLVRIAEAWQDLQRRLAAIDLDGLSLTQQVVYEELVAQKSVLESQIQAMNERWAERLALLGKTDRVNVYNVWKENMVEIVCSQKGRYVINFLAIEYLRKIINDGRSLSDLHRKANKIDEMLETLNTLDEEIKEELQKIARAINIAPDKATKEYEKNSLQAQRDIFNRKF